MRTILIVLLVGLIGAELHTPQYSGNSFIKHKAPDDFNDYADLMLLFKTEENNGLLFFAGNVTMGQYVAVYFKDSYVHLQFDLGSGSVTLRSELEVSLRVWHKLEAWRSGRGGLLKVDGQPWVEGISPGGFGPMLPAKMVYVGGAPWEILPAEVKSTVHQGFHGCIQKASINRNAIGTISNALSSVNVQECGSNPCAARPCGLKGNCTVYHDNYLCLCPFPLKGDHCQTTHEAKLSSIGFKGSGYLKFTQKEVMTHISGDQMDLTITFRLRNHSQHPYYGEQVLLFSGQETKGGDFIKVQITENNRVQLKLDLGSGPVTLTHGHANLTNHQWHTVRVKRSKRHLTLSIDEHNPITTTAPKGSSQLNVYDALYIGGYLPVHGLFPNSGLRGCIRDVMLTSLFRLGHVNQATQAVNIEECSRL